MGIFILIAIVATAVVLYVLFNKKKQEEVESEDSFIATEAPTSPVVEVENKVDTIVETAAQTAERLKSIVNPDIDKPFAKISVPDAVEASGIPVEELTPVPIRKVRKPRAPKAETSVTPTESPKADATIEVAKPKRTYKKREKK